MTEDGLRGDDESVHTARLDVESLLQDGVPDWERIEFEVCCARCGYNLRMLTEPRCPECGLEFAWGEALRQAESESDFLFEHQWRKRPIWSFLVTVWRSFLPRSFWSSVSIHNRISCRPLWFMLAVTILLFAILVPAVAWLVSTGMKLVLARPVFGIGGGSRAISPTLRQLWSIAGELGALAELPLRNPVRYLEVPACATATFVAVLAVVCGMRQTLGRCRVRTVQVLRVIAYAATPVCVVWSFAIPAVLIVGDVVLPDPPTNDLEFLLGPLIAISMFALPLAAFLTVGLRAYLKLPRAAAIAVVSGYVGALVAMMVVIM